MAKRKKIEKIPKKKGKASLKVVRPLGPDGRPLPPLKNTTLMLEMVDGTRQMIEFTSRRDATPGVCNDGTLYVNIPDEKTGVKGIISGIREIWHGADSKEKTQTILG